MKETKKRRYIVSTIMYGMILIFYSASVGGFEREKLQYICSIFPNQSKRNKSTFGDGSVCLGWEYYDNPDTVNTAYCISDRDCITYSDAVAA